jgi:hypothetical protein
MDIVIAMLRFGKVRLHNGFTQQELSNHLTDIGFDLDNPNINGTISLYFKNYFYNNSAVPHLYFMHPQGYFDLLSFESTEQSRQFAMQANKYALLALIISSLLALGSIIISLTDDKTFKIDPSQMKEIKSIVPPSNKTKNVK